MTGEIAALVSGNPSTAEVFTALINILAPLGDYRIEEKKTSLHVVNGRAAFLGIHPRRQGIRLNIVLAGPIESPRVAKCERVSANRFHSEVDVKTPEEVDAELASWISRAYSR